MAQINTTPQAARKIIDAGLPKNISKADMDKLQAAWEKKAKERAEAIEREMRTPTEASKIISFELRKFGSKWQAYHRKDKKWVPLLGDVSLASSAVEAMITIAEEEIFKR